MALITLIICVYHVVTAAMSFQKHKYRYGSCKTLHASVVVSLSLALPHLLTRCRLFFFTIATLEVSFCQSHCPAVTHP
jgi:hypothetical protein